MKLFKVTCVLLATFCAVCKCDPQEDQMRHQQRLADRNSFESPRSHRQEFRGVFPVVEVPPAFSDAQFDSPIRNGNGQHRTCINGQCFNSDGSPVRRHTFSSNTAFRPEQTKKFGNQGQRELSQNYQYGGYDGYGSKKSKKSKYKGPPLATFPCNAAGKCSTCISDRCYPRNYASLRVYPNSHCPPTACDENCAGFVTHSDNCPMCSCPGYATREPCMNQTDCPPHGQCRNFLCNYAPVTSTSAIQCQYAYQCKPTENCQAARCTQEYSGQSHVEGRNCAYDYHCPSGYTCRESTCWTDPRAAQPTRERVASVGSSSPSNSYAQRPCVFHYQCPTTFTCEETRCTNNGIRHNASPCAYDLQCRSAEYCIDRTCIPSKHVGRVQQTSHVYRCEYLPCNHRVNY